MKKKKKINDGRTQKRNRRIISKAEGGTSVAQEDNTVDGLWRTPNEKRGPSEKKERNVISTNAVILLLVATFIQRQAEANDRPNELLANVP